MYPWRKIPLIRFFIPFVIGLLFFSDDQISRELVLGISIGLSIGAFYIHIYLIKRINRKLHLFNSVLVLFCFFFWGSSISLFHNAKAYSNHFSHVYKPSSGFIGEVVTDPIQKKDNVSCQVRINQIVKGSDTINTSGNIQVYIKDELKTNKIAMGDLVFSHALIRTAKAPANPGQFDFKKHLKSKNIFSTCFLAKGTYTKIGENKIGMINRIAMLFRKKLLNAFTRFIPDKKVRGISEAIVFGAKEELDPELKEAFQNTGTIHILAVSGLHVGIFYVLLSFLLRLKKSKGKVLFLKTIILICILCFYALVSGMSPSISRATLMFSVMALGQCFKRRSTTLNSLAFAAFILLVLNPYAIYSVGFQFSFLAVLGISMFYTGLVKLIPVRSSLLKPIVSLGAISIATQITTFPLVIYYFHQFPNFFIVSNLLIVPYVSVILYLGIGLAISSFIIPAIAKLLATLVGLYVNFISDIAEIIQRWPGAISSGIHISFLEMVLIYLFMILVFVGYKFKIKQRHVLAPVLVVMFLCVLGFSLKSVPQSETVMFNYKNQIVLAHKSNDQLFVFGKAKQIADEGFADYVLKPYLIKNRIPDGLILVCTEGSGSVSVKENIYYHGDGVVQINNEVYCLLDQTQGYIKKTPQYDYLIVNGKRSKAFYEAIVPKIGYSQAYVSNNQFQNASVSQFHEPVLALNRCHTIAIRQD